VAYRRYAVPFHEARAGTGKLVGLDAYTWRYLHARYRTVLLVVPAERLSPEPPQEGACRLPALVTPSRQVRDIEETASIDTPAWGPRPSLAKRLLSLIMPAKLVEEAYGKPMVPEEAQAAGLAKILLPLYPTGRLLWMIFTETEEGMLPDEPSTRRIYMDLRGRDPGYAEAEEEARSLCSDAQIKLPRHASRESGRI